MMNSKPNIRRINFFGGGGAGKSTTAAGVFADLKRRIALSPIPNFRVELVTEYVKNWAYEGIAPKGFDQIYLFAEQLRREEIPLRNGVDLVITDSPIMLSAIYGRKNKVPGWGELEEIANKFEEVYPSLNVFLKRGEKPFDPAGRFNSKADAEAMDQYIRTHLKDTTYIEWDFSKSITDLIADTIVKISSRTPGYAGEPCSTNFGGSDF